ncbi:hypothetical protein M3Y99_00067500 [Aphelenchoides fujianensis]|nr:hypothetical protein M3Y99_00067500 [Aphelenchoides fujianensis]
MSPNTQPVEGTKAHHSSLLALFHRKKRQTSAPIAPHSPAAAHKPPSPPSPFSFAQRLRLNRDRRPPKPPTSQSQTLHHEPKPKKSAKKDALSRSKAFSADNIRELDPDFLTDALLALGDQPTVARSTPKHAISTQNPRAADERRLRNCIFEPAVYETMLADSVLACELLTASLDQLAVDFRTKSPQNNPHENTPADQSCFLPAFLSSATAPPISASTRFGMRATSTASITACVFSTTTFTLAHS